MFNYFKKYLLIVIFLGVMPSAYAMETARKAVGAITGLWSKMASIPSTLWSYKIHREAKSEHNKFENIKDFLDSTDINTEEKQLIIDHFSQPGVGVPIWIKNQPKSKKTGISKIIKFLNLLFSKSPQFPSKLEIDEDATALGLELRKHTKISPDAHIPIFADLKVSLKEVLDKFYFNCDSSDLVQPLIKYPYIKLDSLLSRLLPQTIPFRLAHEYAHIEMRYSTIRKIIYLGIASALLSYISLLDKNYNQLTSIASSFGSCLLSVFLSKGYFQQQEEMACDLRAIESTGSTKGIEEFFSYKREFFTVFSNNDWIIVDVKIKLEKAQEYVSWKEKLFSSHPSDAERLRYCKAFAKKYGYDETHLEIDVKAK